METYNMEISGNVNGISVVAWPDGTDSDLGGRIWGCRGEEGSKKADEEDGGAEILHCEVRRKSALCECVLRRLDNGIERKGGRR
jgi:hypothetical protein